MADLVAQPRKRMLMLLCCLGLCGALQLFLAFSIPYFTIGLLGLLVLCGSIGLAREILLRRTRYLLWVGFFQPIPLIMLVYVDYVNLAEALDADSYHVATEDDLERSVQQNVTDRVAAYAGIALDCFVCVLCISLAEASLALHRALHGLESDNQPWLVHLVNALQGVTRAPLRQWAPPVTAAPAAGVVAEEASYFDHIARAMRGFSTATAVPSVATAPAAPAATSEARGPGGSPASRLRRASDGLLNLEKSMALL